MRAALSGQLGWLRHVPVPLFAAPMGLCGLGFTWRRAGEVLEMPPAVGGALHLIGAAVFVALAALYLAKSIRHWPSVVAEFNHPLRINFFSAIAIDVMLIAGAVLPFGRVVAEGLWLLGAVAQMVLAVAIVGRWMTRPLDIQQVNPTWFIPVVGPILAPLAGVPLGYGEAASLLWGVGMLFWLVLFPIVLLRIVCHGGLPLRLAPTLFILLAPPTLGLAGWMALGEAAFGGHAFDMVARLLAATGFFIALVLLSLARPFLKVPFGLPWWAATFPSANLASATLIYHAAVGGPFTAVLAVASLLGASLTVAVIAVRTVRELIAGRLFVPE
ncbi:MAG: C4-dicarboxylate ABC transporter [Azospirillum sp.]|nr:C4-dicarboxylate ABC transporter [Azospirillum sp.]